MLKNFEKFNYSLKYIYVALKNTYIIWLFHKILYLNLAYMCFDCGRKLV